MNTSSQSEIKLTQSTPSTPIEFLVSEGLMLKGDSWGNPKNQTVILLHGGGQTRHAWGITGPTLANQGWHVVAVDQRGHGDSDWDPKGRYKVNDFAKDLLDIAKQFKIPPVAVGASIGGLASLVAAGEYEQEAFSAMVLVDITPRMEKQGLLRVVSFMGEHIDEGFSNLENAAEIIDKYLPHRKKPTDLTGLEKNLRLRENGRYYWHWDPSFLKDKEEPNVVKANEKFSTAAKTIKFPILLIRGRMSDIVTMEAVDEFLEMVPHSHFVDVQQAGHMIAGDKNGIFCHSILQFLSSLTQLES